MDFANGKSRARNTRIFVEELERMGSISSITSRITKTENKTIYHWMQTEITSTWTDLMMVLWFFSLFFLAWFMCRFAYIVSSVNHPAPISSALMFILVGRSVCVCLCAHRLDRETCVIDFYPALCYCWRFDFSFCHTALKPFTEPSAKIISCWMCVCFLYYYSVGAYRCRHFIYRFVFLLP